MTEDVIRDYYNEYNYPSSDRLYQILKKDGIIVKKKEHHRQNFLNNFRLKQY